VVDRLTAPVLPRGTVLTLPTTKEISAFPSVSRTNLLKMIKTKKIPERNI